MVMVSNSFLGYVVENTNGNNHHFGVGPIGDALTFHLTVDYTVAFTSELDISVDSSYAGSWPFMGSIDGFVNASDDLSSGSSNFAYVQGTTQTAPGSPPASVSNSYPVAKNSESAIWTYDTSTNAITAQWFNMDGSKPPTSIVHILGANAFVITGDSGAVERAFGYSAVLTKFRFRSFLRICHGIPFG